MKTLKNILINSTILISFLFTLTSNVLSVQPTAIDIEEEKILLLKRLIEHSQGEDIKEESLPSRHIEFFYPPRGFNFVSQYPDLKKEGQKQKAGTIYRDNDEVYVVFNNLKRSTAIEVLSYYLYPVDVFSYKTLPIKFQKNNNDPITGNVYKSLHDDYFSSDRSFIKGLEKILTPSEEPFKIIFTGYQRGGALSTLSAAYNADRKIGNTYIRPYLITFYPSSVGDKEFAFSLEQNLGLTNILRFSSYFYPSEIVSYLPRFVRPEIGAYQPGIGVYFTLREEIGEYLSRRNIQKMISLWGYTYTFYALYGFQKYGKIPSLLNGVQKTYNILNEKLSTFEWLKGTSTTIKGVRELHKGLFYFGGFLYNSPTFPSLFNELINLKIQNHQFSIPIGVTYMLCVSYFRQIQDLLYNRFPILDEKLKKAIRSYKQEYSIIFDPEDSNAIKNIGRVNLLSRYGDW